MSFTARKIDQEKIDPAVVSELVNELGPTLVAFLSGTRLRANVNKWMIGTEEPSAKEYKRIAFGLEQFLKVAESEGADIARAWFYGVNVGENAPFEAIREDQFDAVSASAQRFIDGSDY